MKVLICNDDGYQAKGISILAKVTAKFADIRVIAPDRNRTAASHSLTLHKPLVIKQAENGFYYSNGTPTDCVHLGLSLFEDFKPDWVFSGVNHGANLGDDVIYSGTVAAAMQGYMMGVPAVAFSLNDKTDQFWGVVEELLAPIIQHILSIKLTKPVLWNINFPACQLSEVKGIKALPLGNRYHNDGVITGHNPMGEPIYWVGLVSDPDFSDLNTDFSANLQGYVTITPIMIDLTAKDELSSTGNVFQKLQL